MMTHEEQYLAQMIQNETIRDLLLQQLNEVIDVSSLGYEISFVPTTYFLVNKEMKAAPYFPTYRYLIEGNPESREIYIPSEVFTITSILRPTKQSVANYLLTLDRMRCQKVFFQPFLTANGSISLYQPQPKGGLIIRVGDIKEYDSLKFVD
jgi:hypothetical protein